jgi:hypothetical protein
MAQNGLTVKGTASEYCKSIAHDAVRGISDEGPSHWWFNLAYYYQAIPNDIEIIGEYLDSC